jgi:hypothetical protein
VIPPQLAAEVEDLRREGLKIDLAEENEWAVVVIHDYPVLPGFSAKKTDLVLRIPKSYPNGKPDMFWTNPDLVLAGGGVPKNADVLELILGVQRRRYSWHPQGWNPARDNLRSFLEFVNSRFSKAV